MTSYFMTTTGDTSRFAGVGGACGCMARAKIEIAGDDLEVLAGLGFKTADNIPGSCPHCGRNIAFYRLNVSSVENLRES